MSAIESIKLIKRIILKKKSCNLGEKDIQILNQIIEEIKSKNRANQIKNISAYVLKIFEILALYETLK